MVVSPMSALVFGVLLLCAAKLPQTWAVQTVNPVQGKILYGSQAGLCGSTGVQCLGWNSATSIVCDGQFVVCGSSGDVEQL